MQLIISVLGPAKEEIEDLINSAIGERVIHHETDYSWNQEDLTFTVFCASERDVMNLKNYIWTWLPRVSKVRSTIRFYKKKGNSPVKLSLGMSVLNSILWG